MTATGDHEGLPLRDETATGETSGPVPAVQNSVDRAAAKRSLETVEIRPSDGWTLLDVKELWSYRELIWMLALRDVRVRYKQSVLGLLWVVAPPLITVIIFSVVFGILMGTRGRPSLPGVPYAVCTFCALVIWQLFASSLRSSGNSLINNRNLILKVYFPRTAILIAPVIAGVFDFVVSFFVLLVLIAGKMLLSGFSYSPGVAVAAAPAFVLLAALTAFSFSLWIAGLGAIYRDFNLFGPVSIQLLMYITPVLYTYHSVAPSLGHLGSLLYALNPMAGVVEGFRWSLLGGSAFPWRLLTLSCVVDCVLLVTGLLMFRRIEPIIVDVI